MPATYVIWSYEHRAWWAPDHRGYTRDLAVAGHYSEAEARAIVTGANVVTLEEVAFPWTGAIADGPWVTRGVAPTSD